MDKSAEVREIARRSIRENLTKRREAKVFIFSIGHFRLVDPAEALELIVEHKASLATIPRKGRQPGRINFQEVARRIRMARGMVGG